jgi:hypothetical protein
MATRRQTPSILTGLAPQRIGVFLPVQSRSLWPGTEVYEWLVEDLRRNDRVDLFGIVYPFGIVSERHLIDCPETFTSSLSCGKRLDQEAALRTRAWLDLYGPGYERFVLPKCGDMMGVWSRVVDGHPIARRVRLVPVRRDRWRDSTFKSALERQTR